MLILLLLPHRGDAWLRDLSRTNDAFNDGARAVTADASGDVIVAGGFGVLFVAKLEQSTGVELWREEIPAPVHNAAVADAVAVDSNGDVLVGGYLDFQFAVIKLDGLTGAELWRQIPGPGTIDGVNKLLIANNDDVFAIGAKSNPAPLSSDFAVFRLDRDTGGVEWSQEIDGGGSPRNDIASDAALDPSGDIVVAGRLVQPGTGSDFAVLKFDGVSGAELWRATVDGTSSDDDWAWSVALDASGDVIAGGHLDNTGTGPDFAVLKFDGGTGAEVWRREVDGTAAGTDLERAAAVGVDSLGDVFAAGNLHDSGTGGDVAVMKLAAATGAEIWREDFGGTAVLADEANDLLTTAAGDVVVAGWLDNVVTAQDFYVFKLDGTTGARLWRQERDGTATDKDPSRDGAASSLAVGPAGYVLVAGFTQNRSTLRDLVVARLDEETGALGALNGSVLVVRDSSDPSKRKLKFVVRDDLVDSAALGADDPIQSGAVVRILNPTTLEEALLPIPPGAGWKALGSPPGEKGYRYKAPKGTGPCTSLVVKPRKLLRVSCKAAAVPIAFTLDEASQGSLAVSAAVGGAPPQCSVFGGLVLRDEPGLFKAKAATAETECP